MPTLTRKKELIKSFQAILELALKEDIYSGDITTSSLGLEGQKARAELIAEEDLIMCGLIFMKTMFYSANKKMKIQSHFKDGDFVKKGKKIATLMGDKALILERERIMLNFLQRLSGVASMTATYQKELQGTGIKLLDTRKTIPGWRRLEKYAVSVGGGTNHRMGLYDLYLIKDNHIEAVGSIENAVQRIKKVKKRGLKIEVECKTMREIREAVKENVDIIMLDNMPPARVEQVLRTIPQTIRVEVSGNITLSEIKKLKHLNIDALSSGAITHSAGSKDISLVFKAIK